MTIDEAVTRYKNNAEHERTHGNLQGCLEFKQLVEWLKDYKRLLGAIEDIKAEITEPNKMDSLENSNLWQVWFLRLINKHTRGKEEE